MGTAKTRIYAVWLIYIDVSVGTDLSRPLPTIEKLEVVETFYASSSIREGAKDVINRSLHGNNNLTISSCPMRKE